MKQTILPLILSLSLVSLAHTADISHRKADLKVQVQSLSGTPLEGATVEVEMLNHAFRFGCATEYEVIKQDKSRYNSTIVANLQKYFNSVTYGNFMKWGYFEGQDDATRMDIATYPQSAFKAFDGTDPFRLRGHATIWGASYQVPSDVKNSNDGTFVHDRVLEHIEAFHNFLKDAGIDNFDLYNEPLHERAEIIEKILPQGSTIQTEAAEIAQWFNKAKEADPKAVLFINDYNILNATWVPNFGEARRYKEFIDAVRDAGGQIDGIGLQAHMGGVIPKEDLTAIIDILAAPMDPTDNYPNGLPGLRIEVTEYDITEANGFPSEADQADLTRNMLEAFFEHPAVDGITIWGMNDSMHWRDNAILFDDSDPDNWVVKQSGQVYVDKVLGEWWEDHAGSSSANGDYTANTFKGTHRVTVTYNGETKEQIVALSEDGTATFEFVATAADAATYDAWSDFIAWDSADSNRAADPDGDGRDNLQEYLTGTDPLSHDRPRTPPTVSQTDGSALNIDFLSRAQGVSILIEYSDDLSTWTNIHELVWPDVVPTPSLTLDQTSLPSGQTMHTLQLANITGFFRITLSEPSQS